MIEQIRPGIYSIKIRFVNSPLKNLNSYVFIGKDRNLLIDTGFNQPECLEDLRNGIKELGLNMNKTDIFATHFHADHCGLIDQIAEKGTRIYMSSIDKVLLEEFILNEDRVWEGYSDWYLQEGYPAEELKEALSKNPAKNFVLKNPVPITALSDGVFLSAGNTKLHCILTPGHTPGHMCLYDVDTQTMVLGDHVLFDITPNITVWAGMHNSLELYLKSLKRIREFPVTIPLPAHRECTISMSARIDELLVHHEKRLEEAMAIIHETPGVNSYQIAGRMKWSIRSKNWDDFPPAQKWFAVGETIAHLYFLVDAGKIKRRVVDGTAIYAVL